MERARCFFILCYFAALVLGVTQWHFAAIAQEPAPVAAEPAANANAPNAPAPANKEPAKPKSRFLWVIYSSVIIGSFILLLSIYFVATVIRLFIELRPEVAMPLEEVAHCEELAKARNYQGLYDFASKCESF